MQWVKSMELIKNNKIPCPICGETTPRLLMTEIRGEIRICPKCILKVSIGRRKVRDFTLEELKVHLIMREENANRIKKEFRPTKCYEIGWTHISIDETKRLFTIPLNRCGDTRNPPVFKFEELQGYDLLEEGIVIESFCRGEKVFLHSSRVYSPVTKTSCELKQESEIISYEFTLHLYLTNPYWDELRFSAGFVTGDRKVIQRTYSKHLGALRRIMKEFAMIMGGIQNERMATPIPEKDPKYLDMNHNQMEHNQLTS